MPSQLQECVHSEVRLLLSSSEAKLLIWNVFLEWIICQEAVSRVACCLLQAAPPPWKRSPTNQSLFNFHFQWISAFLQQLWQSRLLVCKPRLGWKVSSLGAAGSSLVDLEKNNQRIAAFFLHPRHSARWHGSTHAASNVCQSAATVGAMERRRLWPHVEPVLIVLASVSPHLFKYFAGIRRFEGRRRQGILMQQHSTAWTAAEVRCPVLVIPFLSISAGFEHTVGSVWQLMWVFPDQPSFADLLSAFLMGSSAWHPAPRLGVGWLSEEPVQ